jgi:hypothetical protein
LKTQKEGGDGVKEGEEEEEEEEEEGARAHRQC